MVIDIRWGTIGACWKACLECVKKKSDQTNTIPCAPHCACLAMPRLCSSLPSPSTPHLTKCDPCYDTLASFSSEMAWIVPNISTTLLPSTNHCWRRVLRLVIRIIVIKNVWAYLTAISYSLNASGLLWSPANSASYTDLAYITDIKNCSLLRALPMCWRSQDLETATFKRIKYTLSGLYQKRTFLYKPGFYWSGTSKRCGDDQIFRLSWGAQSWRGYGKIAHSGHAYDFGEMSNIDSCGCFRLT